MPRSSFALALGALVLVTVAASADDTPMKLGKRGEVEFTTPVRVASTLLRPGHYQFQHEMTADGQHVLVVRSRATQSGSAGHYAGPTKDTVARVPCTVVPVDAKVTHTELISRTGADGVREITQIRISGEKAGHVIVLQPNS